MTPYYQDEAVTILNLDCREAMRGMDAESVDAIVTDPPYGLSFMGKGWDHGVPGVEFWVEALRVAKPGAHLLAFGGTRTFHRLACAIEDAGWEIRDTVMWVYGSGFPKSLNVATAIAKLSEPKAEPKADEVEFCQWLRDNSTFEAVAQALGRRFWDCEVQIVNAATKERPVMARRALVPTAAKWQGFKSQHQGTIPPRIEELAKPEPQRADTPGDEWTPGKGSGTAGEGDWQGWGTALKPAWEPIIVARKPLIGTVAENVLKHGTGAINVDGCRVEGSAGSGVWGSSNEGCQDGRSFNASPTGKEYRSRPLRISHKDDSKNCYGNGHSGSHAAGTTTVGRWPANLIHDGSDEVLGLFPANVKGGTWNRTAGARHFNNDGEPTGYQTSGSDSSSGSAARFFYCAKASKADRDDGCEGLDEKSTCYMATANGTGKPSVTIDDQGKERDRFTASKRNHHPTVKPTALMRYLCRLVTPPGGTVLDPFMGSGSTGKGAILEGFQFIGIDREPDYCAISEARLKHAIAQRDQRQEDATRQTAFSFSPPPPTQVGTIPRCAPHNPRPTISPTNPADANIRPRET